MERRFEGIVVRIEPEGFGIIRFEEPVAGAEYGFFSNNTVDMHRLFPQLKVGATISGVVTETDQTVLPVERVDVKD